MGQSNESLGLDESEPSDLAAVLFHQLVEGPLVVDAERVDEALAGARHHGVVHADRLLAIDGDAAVEADDLTAKVVGDVAGAAVGPVKVLTHLFVAHLSHRLALPITSAIMAGNTQLIVHRFQLLLLLLTNQGQRHETDDEQRRETDDEPRRRRPPRTFEQWLQHCD